jgi:hypothetical protein
VCSWGCIDPATKVTHRIRAVWFSTAGLRTLCLVALRRIWVASGPDSPLFTRSPDVSALLSNPLLRFCRRCDRQCVTILLSWGFLPLHFVDRRQRRAWQFCRLARLAPSCVSAAICRACVATSRSLNTAAWWNINSCPPARRRFQFSLSCVKCTRKCDARKSVQKLVPEQALACEMELRHASRGCT